MGKIKISRWGNSLAIRLPVDVVRALGVSEGDSVGLNALGPHSFEIRRDEARADTMRRIDQLARPFPPDYKFDREEANAR